MTLAERFNKWDEYRKNLFILSAFGIFVTILLLPFCFFSLPGVPFGFLLGSIVSLIAYITIVKGSSLLLTGNGGAATTGLTFVFVILRFALYGGVLVLAAFCTYRWNFAWLNFWGVFSGIIPMPALISIMELIKRHKAKGAPTSLQSDPSMFKAEEKEAAPEKVEAAPIEVAPIEEGGKDEIPDLLVENDAKPAPIEESEGEDIPLDFGQQGGKSNG